MKNKIQFIIKPREANIGIPVRRILPWSKKRMVGPFIFLDQMGPAFMKAPDDHMDVKPHPHIGLSTLTYLFEGQLMHRDSLGVEQLILPGEVNWMTAGKGISHSEREPQNVRDSDRTIHGLQFWVGLPIEKEDCEPSFFHYEQTDIPVIEQESLSIKIVAGSAFGETSKLLTHSPMIFMVMTAQEEGTFNFNHMPDHEYALYVVKGNLVVGNEILNEHEMVVFEKENDIEVSYSKGSIFALIGGEPFPEPRHIFWNFVSSSKDKIEEAKKAWTDGSFPQVPGDDENIPIPGINPVVNYP